MVKGAVLAAKIGLGESILLAGYFSLEAISPLKLLSFVVICHFVAPHHHSIDTPISVLVVYAD